MRRFMAEAPVGDEQRREDPSVNELQRLVADLTGKEAGLFLPSGTMCNAIAFSVLARRGEAVILDRDAHPNNAEAGGPAWLANVMLRPMDGERGVFTADQVRRVIDPGTTHTSRTALISVENTSNLGGGKVWPRDRLTELRALADEHGLKLHMDGARLMNAVVASGDPASSIASFADTVWIDLSKGLGAPVGAVLAGSEEFIEQARRLKHLFGGAMRQAGIIAAAGIYAFRNHVDRLADDHANARFLADELENIPGVRVVRGPVETNIVFFDVAGTGLTAGEVEAGLNRHGVRMDGYGTDTVIRAVTHLDVTRQDCEQAVIALWTVCTADSIPAPVEQQPITA
jgi:threonine aldolase